MVFSVWSAVKYLKGFLDEVYKPPA
jgi:hypothetical protein